MAQKKNIKAIEAEAKTTCVCFTVTITDWKASSGTASK